MGFFSATCKSDDCDLSILSPYSSGPADETYEHDNTWLAEAVAVTPNGDLHTGTYDGYGRIGGFDAYDAGLDFDDLAVWHKACWKADGSPADYPGPSAHAADQGYFIDGARYDRPAPSSA